LDHRHIHSFPTRRSSDLPKDEETRYNLAYALKKLKEQQKKDDKNKQNQQQKNQDKQKQEQQPQMTKQEAERMLKALQNIEQKLRSEEHTSELQSQSNIVC